MVMCGFIELALGSWRGRVFLVAVVIAVGLVTACGGGDSPQGEGPVVEEKEQQAGQKADATSPPGAAVIESDVPPPIFGRPPEPLTPSAAPPAFRIEVVKPARISYCVLPMVAGDTNARFGWVRAPEKFLPRTLYRFAIEKAVRLEALPANAANKAVPYIAGTVPGYIGPYDRFKLVACSLEGDSAIFTVGYESLSILEPGLNLAAARAYYVIDVSALPTQTKTIRMRLPKKHDFPLTDISITIDSIRCENYCEARAR